MPLELGERLKEKIERFNTSFRHRPLWDFDISNETDALDCLEWLRNQNGVMVLELGNLSQFQIHIPHNEKLFEARFGLDPEKDDGNKIPESLYAVVRSAFEQSQKQYASTRDAGYALIYYYKK